MRLRYALSQLSRPAARRAFGRTWLWICAGGALVTLAAAGWAHLFFVTAVWFVCVFAPVRIAVEVLHSHGPRIRADLVRALSRRPDRYATSERIALMADTLFGKEIVLPRLAPPDLQEKVIEAAARVSQTAFRSRGGPPAVWQAAMSCAGLLVRWTGAIAAGQDGKAGADGNDAAAPTLWDPSASVPDQWVTLRAVAGLAALTKTLTAIYEDSAGRPVESGAALRALSEVTMDYVDQVGLGLEGPPWEVIQGVPDAPMPPDRLSRLADAWLRFCTAPLPAPRRLRAFVETLAG